MVAFFTKTAFYYDYEYIPGKQFDEDLLELVKTVPFPTIDMSRIFKQKRARHPPKRMVVEMEETPKQPPKSVSQKEKNKKTKEDFTSVTKKKPIPYYFAYHQNKLGDKIKTMRCKKCSAFISRGQTECKKCIGFELSGKVFKPKKFKITKVLKRSLPVTSESPSHSKDLQSTSKFDPTTTNVPSKKITVKGKKIGVLNQFSKTKESKRKTLSRSGGKKLANARKVSKISKKSIPEQKTIPINSVNDQVSDEMEKHENPKLDAVGTVLPIEHINISAVQESRANNIQDEETKSDDESNSIESTRDLQNSSMLHLENMNKSYVITTGNRLPKRSTKKFKKQRIPKKMRTCECVVIEGKIHICSNCACHTRTYKDPGNTDDDKNSSFEDSDSINSLSDVQNTIEIDESDEGSDIDLGDSLEQEVDEDFDDFEYSVSNNVSTSSDLNDHTYAMLL